MVGLLSSNSHLFLTDPRIWKHDTFLGDDKFHQ